MSAITKGLGRLALVAGVGLILYVGIVAVNLAVSAVKGDPDRANQHVLQPRVDRGAAGRPRPVPEEPL